MRCRFTRRTSFGRSTGLYDVRLGDDMHVLVGCGLGGGSLVNAGVALRPDARVFADPVWPGQIRQDGLLDEGYARAARWLRPAQHPRRARTDQVRALAPPPRCSRRCTRHAAGRRQLRGQRQPRRHRATRLHPLRRLLRRLQRRRQEHGRAHLPARRRPSRRRGLSPSCKVSPRRRQSPTAAGASTM